MRVDRRRFQEKARLQPKKNGKICSRNDIPGGGGENEQNLGNTYEKIYEE